jgi:UDP-N-acetylglucosamine--dolichyl-phosphate N-acetylglucosaminephosphotransferase
MDIQLIYKYILVFLYAAFATYWATPILLKKLARHGFMRPDKYKPKGSTFVTMGGISMLVGILISLSLSQILMIPHEILGKLFMFYFVVVVYALYGMSDDLFGSSDGDSILSRRYDKIIIVMLLSFPVASLITDTSVNFLGGTLDLGLVFALLLAPFYIMVIANLINVHAGYNGLTMGTSWIILLAIMIKSFLQDGLSENIIFLLPVFGALTGFLPYNLFPAKAHDANIGAFLIGGAIGASLLALNLEWFGVFIFIPHIINFLMDTWTLVIKRKKDVKFGSLRKDGTIEAPATMKYKSLKFLIVSWFRLTEKQATAWLWALTAVFCVLGIIIL